MKKISTLLLIITTLFIISQKNAYSLLNLELFGSFASTPQGAKSDISSSFGGGFGMGIDLTRIGDSIMLQLRFDATYHDFKNSAAGSTKVMVPIFIGTRFIFGSSIMPDWFAFYSDLGYTLLTKSNYDSYGQASIGHAMGIGIGAEFYIYKFIYVGLAVRYYFGNERFLTINAPTLGVRF